MRKISAPQFFHRVHTWVQICGCKIVSSCGVSGRSFRQSRLSRPQEQRLKSRKKARPPIPPMGTGELWLTTEIGGDVGHQNNRAKIQNARTTIMQSGGDCIVLFEGKGPKPELLDFASFCPNSCSPRDSLLPPIVSKVWMLAVTNTLLKSPWLMGAQGGTPGGSR